jgi:hypothetical protein
MRLSAFCTTAAGQSPVFSHSWIDPPVVGYKGWQAVSAAWNWESLTPKCCASPLGTPPPLGGSGKFGTPCDRMQVE